MAVANFPCRGPVGLGPSPHHPADESTGGPNEGIGAGDRKAGRLVVNAIHEDVRFTKAIAAAVRAEIEDLAAWLGLEVTGA